VRDGSACSRRGGQVNDSIDPVPRVTFMRPEFRQQPRLLTVVGRPNGAAEQNQAAMTLAGAKHLTRMPWKRCANRRPRARDRRPHRRSTAPHRPDQARRRPATALFERWEIHEAGARRPRRIGARCSRQPVTEAMSVSPSRALWTSSGKALAYASARWTSTRGHRKWLAVFSTDLVSWCALRTSQTATRWPVR
jgi:hypothetical protein